MIAHVQLLWKLSALLQYTCKFDGTLILSSIVNHCPVTAPKHFNTGKALLWEPQDQDLSLCVARSTEHSKNQLEMVSVTYIVCGGISTEFLQYYQKTEGFICIYYEPSCLSPSCSSTSRLYIWNITF